MGLRSLPRVELRECTGQKLDLRHSQFVGFVADGCTFSEVDLGGIAVEGDLSLRGSQCGGDITLHGATIGQTADFSGVSCRTLSGRDVQIGRRLVFRDLRAVAAQFKRVHVAGHVAGSGFSGGTLVLRESSVAGPIDLSSAHCHHIDLTELDARGSIDASRARVCPADQRCAVSAEDLRCAGDFVVEDCELSGLELTGAHIGIGINAAGARIHSPSGGSLAVGLRDAVVGQVVGLAAGFVATGEVDVSSAVLGALIMTNARFSSPTQVSLRATAAEIRGSFDMSASTFRSSASLTAARIGGQWLMAGVLVRGAGGAIRANRVHVGDGIFIEGNTSVDGELSLDDAQVDGEFVIQGDVDLGEIGGVGLSARRIRVGRQVFFQGLTAHGRVSMADCSIGADLTVNQVIVSGVADAVDAQRAQIGGAVTIESSELSGTLNLNGAHVGGDVLIAGTATRSVTAQSASIAGTWAWTDDGEVRGQIVFDDATIGGRCMLQSGSFSSYEVQPTLQAADLEAEALVLHPDASFTGSVVASSARLRNAVFAAEVGASSGTSVLDLNRAEIGESLELTARSSFSELNLTNARVERFVDRQKSWPTRLKVDGFRYRRLENAGEERLGSKQRLRWLRRDEDIKPMPYEQLAGVFRTTGQDADAADVMIAKRRRGRTLLRGLKRIRDLAFDITLGYGYRAGRIAWGIALTIIAGSIAFHYAWPDHFHSAVAKGDPEPSFSSIVYTLDIVVPVLELHQRSAWQPTGWANTLTVVLTIAGWVLTTTAVAALTGLLRGHSE